MKKMWLERISYGEMKGMASFEAIDIIEARLTCFEGIVKGYTPVKTDNQKVKVVPDTDTRTKCLLGKEITELENTK